MLWGLGLVVALSAAEGVYLGLQDRFGRNVIAGYRAYRAERRAWAALSSGSRNREDK